jgi:hypothetical protein
MMAFFLFNSANAQSIRNYIAECNTVLLDSRFDTKNPSLQYVYDRYSYGNTYLSPCNKYKSLYNVPILKTLIQVNEHDTVNAIKIYMPFDSTLLKGLESDLGPTEHTWMAFAPGVDTTGIIWDRKWFVKNYIVFFSCTKYKALLGEANDDYIIVSIWPQKNMRE